MNGILRNITGLWQEMPSAWSDTLRREESGPQANLARSQETRICLWKIENGVHRDRRRWLWLLETLDCFNQLEIDEIVITGNSRLTTCDRC